MTSKIIKPAIKPRDVSYLDPSQKLDKVAKVVIPEGVKRTEAAPFVDTRYAVEPGFRGEFSREWAERRGACLEAFEMAKEAIAKATGVTA